jgi:arylsulfatase A-like enzyme
MDTRPNILFVMSDDHAAHAIGAYGSGINATPQLDRLAQDGVRLNNCHCINSLCTPSRATILTGQYGHMVGVREWQPLDNRRPVQLQKLLQAAGYTTALFGKWHLGHGVTNDVNEVDNRGPQAVPADPAGFDAWTVLPGQGSYHDPDFLTPAGRSRRRGYVSELITEMALDWLARRRDPGRPFFLCVHHKAPHRPWEPGERYRQLYADEDIPQPETFDDDYAGRPAAAAARMRIIGDLDASDVKGTPPPALTGAALKNWFYQRYIKDYLRCVASVDDSVGRLLDYLDASGQTGNTIVIYTSDQGFFLGDHGWYDKRFIYEHSVRMPFLLRYPQEIAGGTVRTELLTNLDFAPTLLDYAGVPAPAEMQGVSGRALLRGAPPPDWQTAFYYRYWDHGGHNVCAHYGLRTMTHKLVYFHPPAVTWRGAANAEPRLAPYWELFDLTRDPNELNNVHDRPEYAAVRARLKRQLESLQRRYGDTPLHAVESR